MKNILLKITLLLLLINVAHSDMTRVEVGAGAWSQNSSGNIDDKKYYGTDIITDKTNTSTYLWLLFRHPIPILPNIRLEYSSLQNSGIANGIFKNFIATLPAKSSLDASQYDAIAYYNILDETFWITVDVGFGAKILDTTFKADNVLVNGINQNYSQNENIPIPLLYLRGRSEIATTNFAIEADIKGISYSASTMYDIRAKVDYTFNIFSVVKPAIEVGYRSEKIKLDDGSIDYKSNITFEGIYAGVVVKF